jgi:MFS family permease
MSTLPLFCTVELVTIIYTSSIIRVVENVYITGSAFMVGRFSTAVFWGMAADKYGRKPVIIIGVGSVCVSKPFIPAQVIASFWAD